MNTEIKRMWCCLFLLVFIICPVVAESAVYYISSSGLDDNDGLSEQTPWATLGKINSLSRSVASNSTFLFKRGDVFRGEIRLAGSTENATLGAYGEGENPVISGSIEITGWQIHSNNVYVADISEQVAAGTKIEQLFANNQRMLVARYPNVNDALPDPDEGWLEVGTSSNKHSFNDPTLGSYGKPAGYWNGGNLRIRSFSWLFETREIVSSTANGTITVDEDLTETLATSIQPGWGYYLDNILGELDHENEWFFDEATRKVYLYAPGGVDPNTLVVEGSVYELGCYLLWHYHDTTIDGLTFRHQYQDGVMINQSDRVAIRNCTFENIGHNGINMAWNSVGIIIENNMLSDNLEFGIKFISSIPAGGSIIRNNTIYNTAVIAGYGGSGVARACGIRTYGVTGLSIQNNLIENSGYVGMQLEGGGHLVENNVVRYSLLTLDDGGGLFINSPDNTIRGNIVTNSWGNRGPSSGTHNGGNFDNNQMGMGIFFQPYLDGNIVEDNTFANNRSHGIYPDRATNTEIKNNTCFNNGSGAWHGSQFYLTGTGSNQNNLMSGNILVGARADQYTMRTDSSSNIGTYNNQAICNPEKTAHIIDGGDYLSLLQWQALGADRDPGAVDCPALNNPVARILINSQNEAATYNLGFGTFYDVQGNAINNSITLDPFSSVIVFQEDGEFHSLSKLISILKVLAGQQTIAAELLDLDGNGIVTLPDIYYLTGQMSE